MSEDTPHPEDLWGEFASELRRCVQQDLDAARLVEMRCWQTPLREAARALQALNPDDVATYARQGAEVVRALRVADDAWPLPRLMLGSVMNMDTLVVLAGRELQDTGSALEVFRKTLDTGRATAFRAVVTEATADLAQLVRGLQAWDGALTLAATFADAPESDTPSPLPAAQVALLDVLQALPGRSHVDRLESLLAGAIQEAEASARSEAASSTNEGLSGRLRQRWGASVAGASAQLRERRNQGLYKRAGAWTEHHGGLWARIDLLEALLEFRARLDAALERGIETLRHEAVDAVTKPLRSAVGHLAEVREEAQGQEAGSGDDWEAAAEVVSGYRKGTSGAVEAALRALDVPIPTHAADAADRCVDACQALIGSLPASVHAVPVTDGKDDEGPRDASAHLTPREWAGRALDVERLGRIRSALLSVADAAARGLEQAHRAPEVLAYNLDAALDEIRVAAQTGAAVENPWALVRSGLERSEDYLERIIDSLEAAHRTAAQAARDEVASAEIELLARLDREDAWAAELSDAWTDALATVLAVGRSLRTSGLHAAGSTGRVASGAFARAQAGLERARRLIRGGSSGAASAQTLRELWDVDAQAESLPYVYRRLFSAQPVEDPSLFMGREATLATVAAHWADWQAGRTNTLVVTGTWSGGLKSLMKVAATQSGQPELWRRAVLEQRVDTERALAEVLARALWDDPPAVRDLADLATALESRATQSAVHVVHLERAFERTVDGFGLIEAALEFFSRTDSTVAWFVTMPADAWRLVTTVSPAATGLVRHCPVPALDQEGLSAMLKTRHHRSGLALRFDEASMPTGVRRDQKDPDAIERAFFSRLWTLTDGSAPLALLYWVRSAAHDPESSEVVIHWPQELDFGFLEALTWDQVFALQAFAEHGSLSVADHARVFSMPTDRSYEVLESLGNLYLIEPAGSVRRVGEPLRFTTVDPAVAYRVRPVLQSVVHRVLRARHLTV